MNLPVAQHTPSLRDQYSSLLNYDVGHRTYFLQKRSSCFAMFIEAGDTIYGLQKLDVNQMEADC